GVQLRRGDVLFEHSADTAGGQSVAEPVDENSRPTPLCLLARVPLANRGVLPDRFERVGPQWADPFFASLAADPSNLLVEVEVTLAQPDDFADPQSRAVHRLQNRTIANSRGAAQRRRGQQPS